ncbi:hypothetical protein AURDEDRAFT_113826 [Auricularia subglabra TFB-10046 SS5]|nr:hypothetical protein AURDEDRAFT_113826 [Auricularia subglabra TFB-10046 SS5]
MSTKANVWIPPEVLSEISNAATEHVALISGGLRVTSLEPQIALEYAGDPFEFPYTVSHVCSSWRSAVLCTPEVWSRLFIGAGDLWRLFKDLTYGRARSAHMLKEWTKRGGKRPRSIVLDLRFGLVPGGPYNLPVVVPRMCTAIEILLGILSESMQYWQLLRVCVEANRDLGSNLLRCLSLPPFSGHGAVPLLEDLCILLHGYMPGANHALFGGNTPSLTNLTLKSVRPIWPGAGSHIFSGLTCLELQYLQNRASSAYNDAMPTYNQFRAALSCCPDLHSLTLDGFMPNLHPAPEAGSEASLFPLKNLETLRLSHIHDEDLADLILYIPTRNLVELILTLRPSPERTAGEADYNYTGFMQPLTPEPPEEPHPWHTLGKLTHLTLRTIVCEDDDLIILFDRLPQLTHLELGIKKMRFLWLPTEPEPLRFALPALAYLRVFGPERAVAHLEAYEASFAEMMLKRVECACRKLVQLIVPGWLEAKLSEMGTSTGYTGELCVDEETARFRDEYGYEE